MVKITSTKNRRNQSETQYFFRVNYDDDNWQRLEDVLMHNLAAIHPTNRAAILHDAFAIAEAEAGEAGTTPDFTRANGIVR